MVIVILGILASAVAVKWPSSDMKLDAAVLDFTRAVRYAQHMALTRNYDPANPGSAWGVNISSNQYTVRRADSSETVYVRLAAACNLLQITNPAQKTQNFR